MRNALPGLLDPDPPRRRNVLPAMLQDATRVAASAPAAQPQPHAMTAALDPDWFEKLLRRGKSWAQKHDVASPLEFPPIKALRAVLGPDMLANISGPAGAISGFAASTRSPQLMRRFADPGFHNFVIRHGPKQPYSKIRDWAPEGVIEDLWQRYSATPEAQRAAARAADRAKRAQGAALGRRSTDVVQRPVR